MLYLEMLPDEDADNVRLVERGGADAANTNDGHGSALEIEQ